MRRASSPFDSAGFLLVREGFDECGLSLCKMFLTSSQLQNSKAVIQSKDATIQELKEKIAYLEAEVCVWDGPPTGNWVLEKSGHRVGWLGPVQQLLGTGCLGAADSGKTLSLPERAEHHDASHLPWHILGTWALLTVEPGFEGRGHTL